MTSSVGSHAGPDLARAEPEEVGLSSPRLGRLAEAIERDVDSGRIPGAVIAVGRRGKLVYHEAIGYRDKDANTSMTRDSLFWAASMTKPMTAAGALTLLERGALLLGDALATHLPEFGEAQVADPGALERGVLATVPAVRQPTIQDLMRHTSGIVEGELGSTPVHELYVDAVGDGMTDFTGAEFISRLAGLPLLHQPGAVWHYGWGMDLLGLIVESISEQRLGEYLRANVFAQLGMRDTHFGIPEGAEERYAQPLPESPYTGRPQALPDLSRARFHSGGAGVVTTAADYLRFALMLVGGGEWGGSRILGRKTVEQMTSDQLGPEVDDHRIGAEDPSLTGYGFGLGLAVRRVPGLAPVAGSVGDVTWPGAGGTYWWADPQEQLAVVFMAHTPGAAAGEDNRELARAVVLQALED